MQHDYIMKTFMFKPFRGQGQCHSDPKVVRDILESQNQEERNDQESIQSSTTPDLGLQM